MHAPGGGSAEIKALYEITPLMGLHMLLGGNTQIIYKPGYYNEDIGNIWANTEESGNGQADSLEQDKQDSPAPKEVSKSEEKAARQARMNQEYMADALEAARDADAVIYIGGLTHDYDTEGQDRTSMKLPYDQDKLICELLKVRHDTIITMVAGSPVDMSAWSSQASTLLYSWYAGMEGGYALAEVLFGHVNPSGHLPETFPVSEKDCPAVVLGEFPGGDKVRYGEGIFVGYRYYDTYDVAPAFPFGYGLSYTDFCLAGLTVKTAGDKEVEVSFHVSNIGDRAGAAVPQIYVSDKTPKVKKAQKELKAFDKIYLEPGETKQITMQLHADAFSYYDVEQKAFVTDAGTYAILLGKSAGEIVDVAEIELK